MKEVNEKYQGIFGRRSEFISTILMLIGVISAIALRLVLPLSRVNSLYASISWYFAMVLFVIFYTFRIYVEDKRRAIIIENKLIEKIEQKKLKRDELNQINILLNSILVSKVKFNYIILLILSIIFLIFQIIIDFII